MRHPKILVFPGSNRSGSYNARLAGYMAKRLALADADVTRISLADFPLPIFDADMEKQEGTPTNAKRLKKLIEQHQGVFIASPEYNTAITPLLKNTLDWLSRPSEQGEAHSLIYKKRVFAIGSASPGQYGGMRGLIGLRTILEIGVGALVIPEMVAVPGAADAFDDNGDLKQARHVSQADKVVRRLLEEARLRIE